MVTTLDQVDEALAVLGGMQIMVITKQAFDNMLLKEASHDCNN